MNIKIVIAIITIIGVFGYLLFENLFYKEQSSKIQIQGVVENIEYNEKGFPVVTVNDNVYYFSFGNDEVLELGDSIFKENGCSELEVFRKGVYVKSYYGMITTK